MWGMKKISFYKGALVAVKMVAVKIKCDCAEFDNGHAIAQYSTPTPDNNL